MECLLLAGWLVGLLIEGSLVYWFDGLFVCLFVLRFLCVFVCLAKVNVIIVMRSPWPTSQSRSWPHLCFSLPRAYEWTGNKRYSWTCSLCSGTKPIVVETETIPAIRGPMLAPTVCIISKRAARG